MGIGFAIVNIDKKQYLPVSRLGDCPLTRYYLEGDHPLALAMLTCNAQPIGIKPPVGSWWGDRVVAVMDCAPPDELDIITRTEEEPDRNLYMMAWQEFEDISPVVISMFCNRSSEYAHRLARRAKEELESETDEYGKARTLRQVGEVLAKIPCRELQLAMDQHVGPGWVVLYQDALHLNLDD